MPLLKRSLLLHSGFIRTMTWLTWGRLAVASAVVNPEVKRARLTEARKMVRKLGREHDQWARAVAQLLRAATENADGRRDEAIVAMRSALQQLDATGTGYYQTPARYRLGQLLGGDEGRTLIQGAVGDLEAQGVHDPARWSGVHLPGTWSGP